MSKGNVKNTQPTGGICYAALPDCQRSFILNKCHDEAVIAVTQTLNQLRGYYLPQSAGRAEE